MLVFRILLFPGASLCCKSNTHILDELAIIASHRIKTHTILIDDIKMCGQAEFQFIDLATLIRTICRIQPEYRISFEDGCDKNDILVAEIR